MWPKQLRVHSRSHEVEQTRASRTCLAADGRLSAFALGRVHITRLLHVSLAPSTHPQAHIKAMSDSESEYEVGELPHNRTRCQHTERNSVESIMRAKVEGGKRGRKTWVSRAPKPHTAL